MIPNNTNWQQFSVFYVPTYYMNQPDPIVSGKLGGHISEGSSSLEISFSRQQPNPTHPHSHFPLNFL